MWREFITAIGGSALLFAVFGFLSRSIINHFLSKDVEKYKIDLRAENERSLEELKTSLKIIAFEHEIRFSRLHDKRAKIIAELYTRLVGLVHAAEQFVSLFQNPQGPNKLDLFKIVMDEMEKFMPYFEKNRIFLDDSLCGKVDKFLDVLTKPVYQFLGAIAPEEESNVDNTREKLGLWFAAWNSVKDDVAMARKELECEFRNILGVSKETLPKVTNGDAEK
jgi:hypothetical protein